MSLPTLSHSSSCGDRPQNEMPGHGGLGIFSTSLEFFFQLADELTQLNAKRLDQVRDIDERRMPFPSLDTVDVIAAQLGRLGLASRLMPAALRSDRAA